MFEKIKKPFISLLTKVRTLPIFIKISLSVMFIAWAMDESYVSTYTDKIPIFFINKMEIGLVYSEATILFAFLGIMMYWLFWGLKKDKK